MRNEATGDNVTPTIEQETRSIATRWGYGSRLDWWVTVTFIWFMIGLFIDGWAHNNGRVDESFFTPYHAIFYSGFLAVTLVHIGGIFVGRRAGNDWRNALPRGYNLSLVGLFIFGLGGVGDMLWHEMIGIEGSIDALISPTHLLLAIGMALIITGPMRAAGYRETKEEYPPAGLPVLLSLTFLMLVLAFMLQYVYFYVQYWAATGRTTGGVIGQLQEVAGYSSVLIDAAIIAGPVLLVLRRWRFPVGSFTMIFTLNMVLMGAMKMDFLALPAAVLAGILCDVLLVVLRPQPDRPGQFRLFTFLLGMILPAIFLPFLVWQRDVWWTAHVLFGLPVMAGLVGLMLSYMVLPADSMENKRGA